VMPEVMTTALAETDRGAISDEAIDHVVGLMAKAPPSRLARDCRRRTNERAALFIQ